MRSFGACAVSAGLPGARVSVYPEFEGNPDSPADVVLTSFRMSIPEARALAADILAAADAAEGKTVDGEGGGHA